MIGICGGFQMLGRVVHDPHGLEGEPGSSEGLGWLDMETVLGPEKQLRRTHGRLSWTDVPISGYEIHCGISRGDALACPSSLLDDGRSDGALSGDGQILGSYLHGLFDQPQALTALLAWAGLRDAATVDVHALREASIERLADAVENHLDHAALLRLIGRGEPSCEH